MPADRTAPSSWKGIDPDEWTVILNEGRGPLWEAHDMSCSRFVHDLVAGTTTSFSFHGADELDAPEEMTRFRPASSIFGR
ncbi:hypothetical protein [Streptomyces sp. NPDC015130]|uniref:hypothetical protein n=1 Tax=Streptomyces sp. NPDC015130 TaxID=3364940 RepID=UPI0036FC37FB